jgi:hypothetical protein
MYVIVAAGKLVARGRKLALWVMPIARTPDLAATETQLGWSRFGMIKATNFLVPCQLF